MQSEKRKGPAIHAHFAFRFPLFAFDARPDQIRVLGFRWSPAEAPSCEAEDVHIIGAGNSSGQAAMLLAKYARSVTLVAPEDFAERMSRYLLERLRATPNLHFRPGTVVTNAAGEGRLQEITLENVETKEKEKETVPTAALLDRKSVV